jgi:hypothetical protein
MTVRADRRSVPRAAVSAPARPASVPLHRPRAARVRTGRTGAPVEVERRAVAQVRESWLVEDGWWTARPLRRRYWELVTECGRNVVVFRDLTAARAGGQGWFVQGS